MTSSTSSMEPASRRWRPGTVRTGWSRRKLWAPVCSGYPHRSIS